MKKYCLTACAKRKFSAVWETIITISIGLLAVAIAVLVLALMFAIIGTVAQVIALFAFDTWLFHKNVADIGGATVLGTFIAGAGIYFSIQFITWLYKTLFYVTKNITMNIIDPAHAECRLFEECKDN